MRNFFKRLETPFACLVMACIVTVAFVFAYPSLNAQSLHEAPYQTGILRLWHIDSFEGGTGSRANFLSSAAKEFEKKYGWYVLVSVHTKESAERAISEGNLPDMISFGTYFNAAADHVLPLEKYNVEAASLNGKTYAVPWCRGSYFLFGQEGSFSEATDKNTVISQGGSALVQGAAYFYGFSGEIGCESSVRAYVDLINGKYKFMIGTQRDVYRFRTRNFNIDAMPVRAFNDLWQYIGVCASEPAVYAACQDFVSHLLSESTQKKLTRIGMFSAYFDIYGPSDGIMDKAEGIQPQHTVSAWLAEDAQNTLRSLASQALCGDKNGGKNFENFLQ